MGDEYRYAEGGAFVNSIIGEGTSLRGDFELNGLLRIDGTFHGRVRTAGKVLIGKKGCGECDIAAGTVVVGGKVKGTIVATEKITLLSTGELTGTIKTPRLVIEEGVVFNGKCQIITDRDKLEELKRHIADTDRLPEEHTLHPVQRKKEPVAIPASLQSRRMERVT